MAHFARIDQNNVVTDVIVIEKEVLDSGGWGDPNSWIQTSYNTRGGIHYGPDGQPDGGVALRKNYAGIGYMYDAQLDAFIPEKPFPSWTLNANTCLWEAPVAQPSFDPTQQKCVWDEDDQQWVLHS